MNSQLSGASLFSTNENKALLWSVLHGGGKFAGIPDSEIHTIKEIFEQTIYEMSEHYRRSNQPVNLNAINKEAVVIICKKIENVKRSQLQQQNYQKKIDVPQLETIYKAEDLKKERQTLFQNEFKKKEKEMSSILKLKKPEEINFTDDIYDKPIGNDMERLLAEALASRERELEQIKNVTFTSPQQELQSSSAISQVGSNSNQNEKRVSFGTKLHIIENKNETHDNTHHNNHSDDDDVNFIFNKLKKIKTKENENAASNNNVNQINNSDIILKMSQDIDDIKATLTKLMEKINISK